MKKASINCQRIKLSIQSWRLSLKKYTMAINKRLDSYQIYCRSLMVESLSLKNCRNNFRNSRALLSLVTYAQYQLPIKAALDVDSDLSLSTSTYKDKLLTRHLRRLLKNQYTTLGPEAAGNSHTKVMFTRSFSSGYV